jgi:hypothetical protein
MYDFSSETRPCAKKETDPWKPTPTVEDATTPTATSRLECIAPGICTGTLPDASKCVLLVVAVLKPVHQRDHLAGRTVDLADVGIVDST